MTTDRDRSANTLRDRLFKKLLLTFFVEFLDLFLPEVARSIDRNSLWFLTQEYFADLTTGEDKVIDLLVEVQQAGEALLDFADLTDLETWLQAEGQR